MNSGKMDTRKKGWVKSLVLRDDKSVIDCDISDNTVTFAGGQVRRVTERHTRVMGYMRPVSQFNAGKQSEHKERKHFRVPSELPAAKK